MRLIILLGSFLIVHSVEVVSQNNFRIMFYNVENLFDIHDDPLKDDDDFLPDGFMKWTSWKYREKLRNITRVVTAVGGMQSPALVGLCEIENDSVLFDLTKRSPLRAQDYAYITTDSPDERGIDVALLYQRHQFRPLHITEYEIRFSRKNIGPTRNILHVAGEVLNGDTLDLFVCHFPSRSGGQRETEPARLETAALLKNKADSLFALRENAHIVIMGDFNDHPGDKSLSQILEAGSIQPPLQRDKLYNLFHHRTKDPGFGSYKYQGKWEVLDQFIVSGNLLMKENSIHVKNNEAHIFRADFLLEDDEKYYGKKTYRTNMGPRYIGGFSDHLPIHMDLAVILRHQ
ncbi:endonuclease/exonuclease/phosphatase family protein [uncultured Proteiniphilum sp.]|uniref:endonuclease/exonuclease/phosphatase family protein n=1 Tax=uncultured Proteiniphilum sp. TaxID=497637 RepID=UPI00262E07EC|nr:endonuclease/exonuclease/phosphatase family protein [uncultured Proteiniphilum sp.]